MTPFEALFVVTAYAVGCDVRPAHPTRAGTQPVAGFTIAADPAVLPIGSIIYIEGLGERMVHDVGGKVRGNHVDVFMNSCHEARTFGRQKRRAHVVHRPAQQGLRN
jgi:3D (Asp-Asp-Asp) domain-containing protein